ncbi:MAG: hypothetical protein JWO13_1966 [Acidobacteriales bacterium]|nr:hypothetical protein [Terriglobales bacterium]
MPRFLLWVRNYVRLGLKKMTDFRSPRLILCTAVVLLLGSSALAQGKTTPVEYKEGPTNTYFVSCGNQPPYKPRTAVSPVLVSPNGENAAYAKVRVSVGGDIDCYNESELFVRLGKAAEFKRVFQIKPVQGELGNGMKLVDWSPDNTSLLFETIGWQYASDAGLDEGLAVFDVRNGRVKQPFLNNVFKIDPAECLTSIRALGFDGDKHFVVKAHSESYSDAGDNEPGNKACDVPDQLWSVGIRDSSLNKIPGKFALRRNGHNLPSPKK